MGNHAAAVVQEEGGNSDCSAEEFVLQWHFRSSGQQGAEEEVSVLPIFESTQKSGSWNSDPDSLSLSHVPGRRYWGASEEEPCGGGPGVIGFIEKVMD